MKNNFKKKNNQKNQGFTLVEALISITILMISVAAPLSLASQGLIAADIAQRQIVAFYLAQDANEWIINQKNTNRLNGDSMLYELDDCKDDGDSTDHGCAIDTFKVGTAALTSCTAECPQGKLEYNSSFKTYAPGTGNFSGFTRFTKIKPLKMQGAQVLEARISTVVKWTAANRTEQTYLLESNISFW